MVNGRIINVGEEVSNIGMMDQFMKDIGPMIWPTEEED